MQLKNDIESRNALDQTIYAYYKKVGNRHVRNFSHAVDPSEMHFDTYFLVDRKHVIRYGINFDRGFWLGAVALGIGPHYFGAADFWSYENSTRFTLEATTEGVEKNLALLDEFLGYKYPKPWETTRKLE